MILINRVSALLYEYLIKGEAQRLVDAMNLIQDEYDKPSIQPNTITLPMPVDDLASAADANKGYLVVQNDEADASGPIEPGMYVRVFGNAPEEERFALFSVAVITPQFTILVYIGGP